MALSPALPIFTRTVRSETNVSPSVSAVTVTEVAASPSFTLDGSRLDSLISVASSSVIVMLVPFTVRSAFVPDTVIVSSPSISVSSVGVRVNVALPLVFPASMVTSKAVTAA